LLGHIKKLLPFVAVLLFFSACADRERLGMLPAYAESSNYEARLAGENDAALAIECSVSLLSLSRSLGSAYSAEATVTAVGADAALASVVSGSADIALFGGDLSAPARHDGVNAMVIGIEVIRLLTGMDNARYDISLDEIYALFIGDDAFDDWDDWGDWDDEYSDDWDDDTLDFLQPEEYIALTRPGVTSRVLFEEIFHLRDNVGGVLQSLIPVYANVFDNDADVVAFVTANAETVGVVMAASDPQGVRSLSIEGTAPGADGYIGQREIILAYRPGNARAASFIAYLQSGALDGVFVDNNVMRIQ